MKKQQGERFSEETRRRKLLHFLESEEPAWKDEDHPELKQGSAAWVRQLRSESEIRLESIRASSRGRRKK